MHVHREDYPTHQTSQAETINNTKPLLRFSHFDRPIERRPLDGECRKTPVAPLNPGPVASCSTDKIGRPSCNIAFVKPHLGIGFPEVQARKSPPSPAAHPHIYASRSNCPFFATCSRSFDWSLMPLEESASAVRFSPLAPTPTPTWTPTTMTNSTPMDVVFPRHEPLSPPRHYSRRPFPFSERSCSEIRDSHERRPFPRRHIRTFQCICESVRHLSR